MKQKLTCCMLLCILLCSLMGCQHRGASLPEGVSEDALLKAARSVLVLLNTGGYEDVYSRLRADAQSTTGAEEIRSYMEAVFAESGSYQEETDAMTTGQTLESTGEAYSTAVLYCKHESGKVIYRIAFSAELELMGFTVAKK